MQQYLDVLAEILDRGVQKTDPQGVGNINITGAQMRFDLTDGFPLVTTRSLKGSWRAMRAELLWFLSGSTKATDLHKYGVKLWDQWATADICIQMGLPLGELGPIYGHHWRNFGATKFANGYYAHDGVDQITKIINQIRENPDSRRHVITAWDPRNVDDVFVAPCHITLHFVHRGNGVLDLHLFQRSCDVPVGIPFNIAEYSLLLMMVAQVTGLKAGEFVHSLSDAHIYLDQIDGVREQLKREPLTLPKVKINPDITNIFDFGMDDFELDYYESHPPIKYPVAV